MSSWTRERVDSLAPDPQSIKAAMGLAKQAKWPLMGSDGRAAWGECKGSGKKPYQTRVDLEALAYKCSCPSRKFPCKHSLGLLYLMADLGDGFPSADPPEWVSDWLETRQAREEKKVERAKAKAEKPVDEKAQAKRREKREQKVSDGITDLRTWMQDIVRNGLIETQRQPYKFWDGPARRLIDAQAPGLARRVQELGGVAIGARSTSPDWAERILVQLGEVHLLVEGWERRESLPEALRQTVRNEIGFATPSEEVLAGEKVDDHWLVNAVYSEELENSLKVQRAWLKGIKSGRDALILSFAHRAGSFDFTALEGTLLDAELAFYPGVLPMRALVAQRRDKAPKLPTNVPGYQLLPKALEAYCTAVSVDPFLKRFPIALDAASLVKQKSKWFLADSEMNAVPMKVNTDHIWPMIAISGGHPMRIFGEWNGEVFRPLTAIQEGAWRRLD